MICDKSDRVIWYSSRGDGGGLRGTSLVGGAVLGVLALAVLGVFVLHQVAVFEIVGFTFSGAPEHVFDGADTLRGELGLGHSGHSGSRRRVELIKEVIGERGTTHGSRVGGSVKGQKLVDTVWVSIPQQDEERIPAGEDEVDS